MIISLVTTKGGAGRSTIALNLAVASALSGASTLLIDADPQQAVKRAYDRRAQLPSSDQSLAVFQSQSLISGDAKFRPDLRAYGLSFDTVIVDTPSTNSEALWSIVATSDIALVPIAAGYQDIEAAVEVSHYLDVVRKKNQTLLTHCLLNQFIDGAAINDSFFRNRSQLLNRLQATAHMMLTHRSELATAFVYGLGVLEYEPTSPAADKINSIYHELKWLMER